MTVDDARALLGIARNEAENLWLALRACKLSERETAVAVLIAEAVSRQFEAQIAWVAAPPLGDRGH